MKYRSLGRTSMNVSEVGLGCNRLGGADRPDEHWIGLVRQAVEAGVTLFDTAECYQHGRSEEILGKALRPSDEAVVATKMSPRRPGASEADISPATMAAVVETNLRRLRRECVDIYQLHNPSREAMERFDWAEGMEALKRAGKIRFRAVSAATVDDAAWLIEQSLVEVVQITYNIFQPEAELGLFDLAERAGVGVLVRMPLARGVLSGKFAPGEAMAPDHRANLDGDLALRRIEHVETLRSLGAGYEGGLTRLAHHFSLAPPAVSAIIPGARTSEQLRENVAASDGGILPDDVAAEIRRIRRSWEG